MNSVRAPTAGVGVGCARVLGVRSKICCDDSAWLPVGSEWYSKDVFDVPEVWDQPRTNGNPATVAMVVFVDDGRRVGDGGASGGRMVRKKAFHDPGHQFRPTAQ